MMQRSVLILEQGGRGGVADYTGALAAGLADRGWRVEIATATDNLYPPYPGVTVHPTFKYVRAGSPLRDALRRVKLGAVINGVRFLLAIPRVVRIGRRVDLVHSQGWELAPLGVVMMAALRLAGVTIVQTEHNTFERGGMSFHRSHKLKAAMSVRTIVHTEWDVENLEPPASERAAVIPHGEYGGLARTGGSADRAEARAELGLPDGAVTTLMFGQLRHDKGIGDLVEAVRRVPDLHLLIGGPGHRRPLRRCRPAGNARAAGAGDHPRGLPQHGGGGEAVCRHRHGHAALQDGEPERRAAALVRLRAPGGRLPRGRPSGGSGGRRDRLDLRAAGRGCARRRAPGHGRCRRRGVRAAWGRGGPARGRALFLAGNCAVDGGGLLRSGRTALPPSRQLPRTSPRLAGNRPPRRAEPALRPIAAAVQGGTTACRLPSRRHVLLQRARVPYATSSTA